MRRVQSWLEEYGDSHRHPVNKAIHWVCIPVIMQSVIALCACLPFPARSAFWHGGTVLGILALFYYAALSWRLTLGMGVVLGGLLGGVVVLARLPLPLWSTATGMFLIAWIAQFAGHAIEGKRPSFLRDIQFLLIGPLWILAAIYRRLGLSA